MPHLVISYVILATDLILEVLFSKIWYSQKFRNTISEAFVLIQSFSDIVKKWKTSTDRHLLLQLISSHKEECWLKIKNIVLESW